MAMKFSQNGTSSVSGSPENFSPSVPETLNQIPSSYPGIMAPRKYPTMLGTSNDSSLITESNSPKSGSSFMSNAINNSPVSGGEFMSNASLSGPSVGFDLPPQRKVSSEDAGWACGQKRQANPLGNHVLFGSSVMNSKKRRLEMERNDSSYPNSALPQMRTQNHTQCYNPEIGTSNVQHHVLQNQLENQIPMQTPREVQLQALNGGLCIRKLMNSVVHQRERPADNNITFWRKYVEHYYAPGAKKRWCLLNHGNIARHSKGIFSQALTDTWNCSLCGSKTRKGFEATYEVLPRLNKIYFDSGIIDEFLYLDFPQEQSISSGFMLTFGKAVQESVYGDFRVSHEGQLRIRFTHELKIKSWEFCIRSHEELIPRNLVGTKVNEFIENVARYQDNIDSKGTDEIPTQHFVTYRNKVANAGSSLARRLDLPLVNDLGFSKQFVRSLQISEVFNSMEDLMKCSLSNNISPMESLKRYALQLAYVKYINSLPERGASMENTQVHPTFTADICNDSYDPNMTDQTPNMGREPTISPPNYYPNAMVNQPDIHRNFNRKAPCNLVSNDSDETTKAINDLLRMMRMEKAQADVIEFQNAKGNTRFVYDPNVDGSQYIHDGVQLRAPGPYRGGNKGVGLGSSSRTFQGRDLTKQETLSDEEFASILAAYHTFRENGGRL